MPLPQEERGGIEGYVVKTKEIVKTLLETAISRGKEVFTPDELLAQADVLAAEARKAKGPAALPLIDQARALYGKARKGYFKKFFADAKEDECHTKSFELMQLQSRIEDEHGL